MKSLNWSERVNENWQTRRAWEAYIKEPNICVVCGSCVWPQPRRCGITQAKLQLCCSLRCSSLLGAKHRGAKIGREKNEKGWYRKTCPVCQKLMTWQAKRCRTCRFAHEKEIFLNESLGSLSARKSKGWGTLRAQIAAIARRIYIGSERTAACIYCGYDKTYDVCHIEPVSSFPKTATLTQVNAIDNLMALCPNHHWEFDNGLLSLEEIRKRPVLQ